MIVGLDMGGTHIDAVIIENGQIINTVKKPTVDDNLLESIWTALQELLHGYDKSKIERINLSTTVSTNAIVEDKTSPVGMIIQSGPGLPNDFLACGQENVFISGYVDHRGKPVQDLDLDEIHRASEQFKRAGIEHIGVVTKFSTRNPTHEMTIKEIMSPHFSHITMGHSISGKLNFPRRTFTSYLNAAVQDTFSDFSMSIGESLRREGIDAPVYILKADGGTTNLLGAEERPVETILSGPAASFMGLNSMLDTDEDALFLDIGGTTTDIFFLADGVPLFEPLGIKIGPHNTLVRAIYSVSIGLGGDSKITIEDDSIKIGPERLGKPYALGGPMPTPTDAMIYLNLIDTGDRQKALEAMTRIGSQVDLSPREAAERIIETMGEIIEKNVGILLDDINSRPVYTVKELLQCKEIDPKVIGLIGGPATILRPILKSKFNIPCYCPPHAHVANAIGAALANITTEITMIADTSKGTLTVPELGIYENIDSRFTLDSARARAIELLKKNALYLGAIEEILEPEIIEESSFNMVKGFSTEGKNIRVRAQIKPGLMYTLRGDDNY